MTNGLLWGLDPVFWVHSKFFIQDLCSMQEINGAAPEVFEYKGRPLYKVQVMGIVTAIQRKSRHLILDSEFIQLTFSR